MALVARRAILLAALACSALAGCSGFTARQSAGNDRCREFAVSGGYPFLRGGPTSGGNSTIEQLPGAPPLVLSGPPESGVSHLDEEQYLQDWCLKNLT
jgi:hypothetical protein